LQDWGLLLDEELLEDEPLDDEPVDEAPLDDEPLPASPPLSTAHAMSGHTEPHTTGPPLHAGHACCPGGQTWAQYRRPVHDSQSVSPGEHLEDEPPEVDPEIPDVASLVEDVVEPEIRDDAFDDDAAPPPASPARTNASPPHATALAPITRTTPELHPRARLDPSIVAPC
jgi:hypothetical protein